MKQKQTAALLALGMALLPLTTHAAPKARVSPAQAASAATAKIPGKVLSTTYEFEDGHWQYAVLIKKRSGLMYEVEVSSITARVTATEKTSPAAEATEAAADNKAAMKARKKG